MSSTGDEGEKEEEEGSTKVRYCPSCMKLGIRTPVENYRKKPMQYCTFHYWLMTTSRLGEFSLDGYVNGSRLHSFVVSLPSPDEMRLMQAS